jgi:hypothetical protein
VAQARAVAIVAAIEVEIGVGTAEETEAAGDAVADLDAAAAAVVDHRRDSSKIQVAGAIYRPRSTLHRPVIARIAAATTTVARRIAGRSVDLIAVGIVTPAVDRSVDLARQSSRAKTTSCCRVNP